MPSICVDLTQGCVSPTCTTQVQKLLGSIGDRFIGIVDEPTEEAAWLDLRQWPGIEEYLADCRRVSKGGIHADQRKARAAGYSAAEMVRANYAADIEAIHRSLPERQGKPMRDAYLKPLPRPSSWLPVRAPTCPKHWVCDFGIFAPTEPTAPRRCRAYITVQRVGALALYSMIIGHGDALRDGVMGALHAHVVSALLDRARPASIGLAGIMYAGATQGTDGLQHWKRKALFVPARLTIF